MTCPTLDEYLTAARNLAGLLRKAFDEPGSVTRGQIRHQLVIFERLDRQANTDRRTTNGDRRQTSA
jgi:hypothetical protein